MLLTVFDRKKIQILLTVPLFSERKITLKSHGKVIPVAGVDNEAYFSETEKIDENSEKTTADSPQTLEIQWSSIISVFMGDVLDNIVDGLAVGVSWAVGPDYNFFSTFPLAKITHINFV